MNSYVPIRCHLSINAIFLFPHIYVSQIKLPPSRVVPHARGLSLGPVQYVPAYSGSRYGPLTDVFGAQPC